MKAVETMPTVTSVNNKCVFLATTALEDFWDTSMPMVFLGEWCCRYSRRAYWEPLKGEIMQTPLVSSKHLAAAYRYSNGIYEHVLPLLSQALNRIHKVDYSTRYWRVVIGPWLFHYIDMLYDRYMSIRNALDMYPELTTYGVTDNGYTCFRDTSDHILKSLDDSYNLHIYTRILTALGKEVPKRVLHLPHEETIAPRKSFKRKIYSHIAKQFQNNKDIIISNSYFDGRVECNIVARTFGRVWPSVQLKTDMPVMPIDHQSRDLLSDNLPVDNEFLNILRSCLPLDIPQSFVETFTAIAKAVKANYPVAPKAVFSAASWYYDEPFKQWAAGAAENGTRLIGVQYGGGFGSSSFMSLEEHDLEISDRYYSWGWERSDCHAEVKVMPASKLSARTYLGADNRKEGILFVGTSTSRYLYRFQQCANYQFADYLLSQGRFINELLPQVRKKLRVRPHREDYGWDIRQRMQDVFPDVDIEDWQVSLLDSLKNCRLYVCDHSSTTLLEALAVNKPTILYWDSALFELRDSAKPYFDALNTAGILFFSPEEAAKAVNSAYDDVESWWNEPARQAARRLFCDRFALTAADPVNAWVNEFKRTINELQ